MSFTFIDRNHFRLFATLPIVKNQEYPSPDKHEDTVCKAARQYAMWRGMPFHDMQILWEDIYTEHPFALLQAHVRGRVPEGLDRCCQDAGIANCQCKAYPRTANTN